VAAGGGVAGPLEDAGPLAVGAARVFGFGAVAPAAGGVASESPAAGRVASTDGSGVVEGDGVSRARGAVST
jgi:hypothetical protein